MASAVADYAEDIGTIATGAWPQKAVATLSLASEVFSPVSVRDVKGIGKFVLRVQKQDILDDKLVKNVKNEIDAVKMRTHGNKLDDKPAEGYTLRDRNTGEVRKYGETTRGEEKFGEGSQKRYSKNELKSNDVDYQKEISGTKKEMHQWQHEQILKHKEEFGKRPHFNKSDY